MVDPDSSEIRRPVPAVGAFIIKDNKILLVKRGLEPGLGKWTIPGGSVEWGETLEDAVKREVLEETGMTVEVGDFAGITDLIVRKDGEITFHYVLIDYFAEVVSGNLQAADDVTECQWVPLSELRNMDLTETVVEMLTELKLI